MSVSSDKEVLTRIEATKVGKPFAKIDRVMWHPQPTGVLAGDFVDSCPFEGCTEDAGRAIASSVASTFTFDGSRVFQTAMVSSYFLLKKAPLEDRLGGILEHAPSRMSIDDYIWSTRSNDELDAHYLPLPVQASTSQGQWFWQRTPCVAPKAVLPDLARRLCDGQLSYADYNLEDHEVIGGPGTIPHPPWFLTVEVARHPPTSKIAQSFDIGFFSH
ncbi:hypothetical protein BKA70DRAFT_1232385 [Coprinopsis sp. MPI-PUGE-AT-0042]|nr:hypothetical protein BKA70DRAFT_1232385 [Coprinopsis sp. MPI-PUGE-AT-0042]